MRHWSGDPPRGDPNGEQAGEPAPPVLRAARVVPIHATHGRNATPAQRRADERAARVRARFEAEAAARAEAAALAAAQAKTRGTKVERGILIIDGTIAIGGAAAAYWVDPLFLVTCAVSGALSLIAGATGVSPWTPLLKLGTGRRRRR